MLYIIWTAFRFFTADLRCKSSLQRDTCKLLPSSWVTFISKFSVSLFLSVILTRACEGIRRREESLEWHCSHLKRAKYVYQPVSVCYSGRFILSTNGDTTHYTCSVEEEGSVKLFQFWSINISSFTHFFHFVNIFFHHKRLCLMFQRYDLFSSFAVGPFFYRRLFTTYDKTDQQTDKMLLNNLWHFRRGQIIQ